MKKLVNSLMLGLLVLMVQLTVQAQTGAIGGAVKDANGAVIPGATVTIKGEAGQEYTVTTNSNGAYFVPAVGNGLYSVTVTSPNFKTSIVRNVKVDVGTPATVDVALEAGQISEEVIVTSGGEVLQTLSPTVGTSITGRQITETPIQSRDALDLVTALPGTNTVGTVRTSSINGLPKSAVAITIDGVDVQDNYLKSSDGFFTYVRPRIDAIDEVTVSTAVPGADAGGDGAVRIQMATRRGNNTYSGGLYWQHRDESLNANYWQNNRDKIQRNKIRLNQFGGRVGGPIPFFNFGEGVPMFHSGKDRAFFFVNYEEYRIPEASPTRTRQLLTPAAQAGNFSWTATTASLPGVLPAGVTCAVASSTLSQCTRNILNLPNGNPGGLPVTLDSTIQGLYSQIRAATAGTGVFAAGTSPNRQQYQFVNTGMQKRRFLTTRIDVNITKNHSVENVNNWQPFRSTADFLNALDPLFPGLPNGGAQNSDRNSNSTALRSSIGQNIVNEARFSRLWGLSGFTLLGGQEAFDTPVGRFNLSGAIAAPGVTGYIVRPSEQIRTTPTYDFSDTLTWIKGSHTLQFGGQYKLVKTKDTTQAAIAPTVALGIVGTDPAAAMFNATNGGLNFPGADATEIAEATALYGTLIGRVSGFTSTARLTAEGNYVYEGVTYRETKQQTMGVFAQDSWRVRPNLTLNFGVRWQPQTGYILGTENFTRLTNFDMVYDVSGPGNLFKPGTLAGVVPTVTGIKDGDSAYETDWNNFAPSVGMVWSPEFSGGFMKSIFGDPGKSVIRAGFSRAFIREGTLLPTNSLGINPGGALAANRNTGTPAGSFTVGSLLRTPGNPNLTPFQPTFPSTYPLPSYPLTLTAADNAVAFTPDLKTGYVDSWTIGYQRELDKNTVIELRYVGNRGKDMLRYYTINEINTIENGFAAEFRLAQANLAYNLANGFGATFAHTTAGSTNPLPIFQSYYFGAGSVPTNTGQYTNAEYTNVANLNALHPNINNVVGLVGTLRNTLGRRNNAIAAGRPSNFIDNCPTTIGFCFLIDNSEKSSYDGGVVELRRRLSNGLRVQASYVYAKAFTNAYAGATNLGGVGVADQNNNSSVTLRNPDLDDSESQVDLRHAFKFDATYDLPFGKGQRFGGGSNWFTNALIGGWSIAPVLRWQSGSPILLENVQLVGMTKKELQKAIGVYKDTLLPSALIGQNPAIVGPTYNHVTYLPADIIENTIKAISFSANGTAYSGNGAPTGRFLAPAGYGGCQIKFVGDCGFRKLVLYGPSFFKLDSALIKKIQIDEKRNVELRATFFDVLNKTNWRIGGWTANVSTLGLGTGFGQFTTASGSAYQDPFGSNDPGGRVIDLSLRINF